MAKIVTFTRAAEADSDDGYFWYEIWAKGFTPDPASPSTNTDCPAPIAAMTC